MKDDMKITNDDSVEIFCKQRQYEITQESNENNASR